MKGNRLIIIHLLFELLGIHNKTWNRLIVCKQMSWVTFKKRNQQNVFTNHIYIIHTYEENLALNKLKWFICH